MRFRISTRPPLAALRAWFDPDVTGPDLDVAAIKRQLCARVRALHDESGDPSALSLSIDGFELLNDSSAAVIKENDLVLISNVGSKKRRASFTHEPPSKKKPLSKPNASACSVQSETAGCSSSEDEESDTSESTSSLSLSSSASASSASSASDEDENNGEDEDEPASEESSPEVKSSRRPATPRAATVAIDKVTQQLVPPGQGKLATHSRNARRRLKRMFERARSRAEVIAMQAVPSNSSNAIPLGARASDDMGTDQINETAVVSQATNPNESFRSDYMNVTLKNKNKKRIWRSLTSTTPTRIIFSNGVHGQTLSPEETPLPLEAASETPRVMTPSERQARGLLPSNILVSSIELEAEKWNEKKKKKQRNWYGYDEEVENIIDDTAVDAVDSDVQMLDYGEQETAKQAVSTAVSQGLDWTLVDNKWDTYPIITDASTLKPGMLVGWKALAIHPTTFTPEMLVLVARVNEINLVMKSINVVNLIRPGSEQIAFGSELSETKADSSELLANEETYPISDVCEVPWKLITI